jgi:acyl-CoA synthetase (AMP-forming)/AMP-acid ligase II
VNIAMLLELPAAVAADQPIVADDDLALTFGELGSDVARVAGLLRSHGVGPGDRVGIFAMSSVRAVEVMLAAAALGAVAVPMNYRARGGEVAHLFTDSEVQVVFVDPRYEADLREAVTDGPTLVSLDESSLAATLAATDPIAEFASAGDDALLLYTSGTTALPKAVRLTHEALTSFVLEAGPMADGSDRGTTVIAVPLYHVAGLTTLLVSLFTGRRIYLQREFTPAGWLDAVEREGVTDAFLVPTMLKRVLDEDVEARDLSRLRMVRYGAAPMPETVIVRALERFPATTDFLGAYGLTETTSTVAVLGAADHRLEGAPEEVERKRRRLTSVGRVLDDVEIEIRGDESQPLPAGSVGRVSLRTARAMVGYAGGASTGGTGAAGGWVETGDLGYLDDGGYLFLVGRAGDMIVRGGENIAPQEVEHVLAAHPAVDVAAVVGLPDEEWGQRVVAAVIPAAGHDGCEEDVIAWCRGELAGFKRPERIVFVDELPHTSTGKLMRRRLVDTVFAAQPSAVDEESADA